jgi:hypothetical protein
LSAVAGVAFAQEKPVDPLVTLRSEAEKSSANWEALAKGLEAKIAHLLPCDPKSKAAVEEVSAASSARLAAVSTYLRAAAARAKNDTEAAKRVLAAQTALAGGWNTERAEADQERVAIEGQIADLKESMRVRGSLSGAEQVLEEIAAMTKERSAKADEQSGFRDTLASLLGGLVVAYQDRQAALENESALLDAESAKWSVYYSARLARAATECSIISPNAQRRRPR